MNIKNIFRIIPLCYVIVFLQFGCDSSKKDDVLDESVISGKIENYEKEKFSLTYDEFSLLRSTGKKIIEIDEKGNFHVKLDINNPIKGVIDFGRLQDTTGNGHNRQVYIYLEPGDSLHIKADIDVLSDPDIIKNTLTITGEESAVKNNQFVNTEDNVWNSYPQRVQNNSSFIRMKAPAEYKKTVDSLRDLKLAYLDKYSDTSQLSPKLKEFYKDDYVDLAIIRKFNYPSTNKHFNDGKEAKLPLDYYDFVEEVKISSDLDDKGLPYMRYTHFFLTNKFELKKQDGYQESYLAFLDSELSGRQKYIYMAYSLGSDFNPEIYSTFGENSPYPDISKIVKEKYGHLENMLPGNPAPHVVFTTMENDTILSSNFYKDKFIYIDFWATWCKPCIREIPDLLQLEKEYHDQNIRFVSVSFDEKKETWKEYVKKEGLTGIQFWVDKPNKKIYDEGFNINMIPRFVLIDDEGKIIDANAPRPSSGKDIRTLLDEALGKKSNIL